MHGYADQKGEEVVHREECDGCDRRVDHEKRIRHAQNHRRARHTEKHGIDLRCVVHGLDRARDGVDECGCAKYQCDTDNDRACNAPA